MEESRARGAFSLVYHARKRFGDAIAVEDLTPTELALVEADRQNLITELAHKGVRARQLNKAARLRAEADALEALALAGAS